MKFFLGLTASVFLGVVHSFGQANLSAPEPDVPKAKLAEFRAKVDPVLKRVCVECHGPKKQKGKFRVDTLDPDLLKGKDVSWWLEVFDVIGNGEMPPEDAKVQLADKEKAQIIDWLSGEIQLASQVRRSEQGHTSFFNDLEIFSLLRKLKLFSDIAIVLLDLVFLLASLVIRSISQLSFERLIAVTNPVRLPPIIHIFCFFMILFFIN